MLSTRYTNSAGTIDKREWSAVAAFSVEAGREGIGKLRQRLMEAYPESLEACYKALVRVNITSPAPRVATKQPILSEEREDLHFGMTQVAMLNAIDQTCELCRKRL